MKLLGSLITRRPISISLIFLIVLIGLITGATQMELATGNETLMSTDSDVYKDNQKLEKYFGGESIIILNTSEEENGILSVNNFKQMKKLEDSLKQYHEIYTFISPASIMEQLKSKQSREMSGSMQPSLPDNQASLNSLLYEDGQLRSIFNELILDDNHSIMMIKLEGNTGDPVKEALVKSIKEQLEREPFEGVHTIVTGKPVIDSAVHISMEASMKKMIMIAVVIMLAVLTVVFPVRWRILAIPIILLSVLATLGLMGYVDVPMTMVSMAVFPILIGLGVDYAIQFQNRYEEELAKGESANV
ncbi:MAG: MMPL family transporter [Paenibacillaceae bacterium]